MTREHKKFFLITRATLRLMSQNIYWARDSIITYFPCVTVFCKYIQCCNVSLIRTMNINFRNYLHSNVCIYVIIEWIARIIWLALRYLFVARKKNSYKEFDKYVTQIIIYFYIYVYIVWTSYTVYSNIIVGKSKNLSLAILFLWMEIKCDEEETLLSFHWNWSQISIKSLIPRHTFDAWKNYL